MHADIVTTKQINSTHTHACLNQHARIVCIAFMLFDHFLEGRKEKLI
jgi:hypothetical protein